MDATFFNSLPSNIPEREKKILEAVAAGGHDPISWMSISSKIGDKVGEMFVSSDALKIGGVRINASAVLTQLIADVTGLLAPPANVLDLRHIQAGLKIAPCPIDVSAPGAYAKMSSVEWTLSHSAEVDEEIRKSMSIGARPTGPIDSSLISTSNVNLRKGPGTGHAVIAVIPKGSTVKAVNPEPQDGFYQVDHQGAVGWSSGQYYVTDETDPGSDPILTSTVGKTWLTLCNDLTQLNNLSFFPAGQDGAVNYGWHYPDYPGGGMIQTKGHKHDRWHVDYSQIVILMRADMLVDGVAMDVLEVAQDPDLAPLVMGSEGALKILRQPGVEYGEVAALGRP